MYLALFPNTYDMYNVHIYKLIYILRHKSLRFDNVYVKDRMPDSLLSLSFSKYLTYLQTTVYLICIPELRQISFVAVQIQYNDKIKQYLYRY